MNTKFSTTAVIRLLLAALAALTLAACASQAPKAESGDQEAKTHSFDPWEGDGMEIPLDGSSLEAFETSLARVKAHTSDNDYITLINAIEYLLLYDLSANRDRTRLAANLDGLTPNEVIDRVSWRKVPPAGGERRERPQESTIEP